MCGIAGDVGETIDAFNDTPADEADDPDLKMFHVKSSYPSC